MRVPGIGPLAVERILETRKNGSLRRLEDVRLAGKRLEKASKYVIMEK